MNARAEEGALDTLRPQGQRRWHLKEEAGFPAPCRDVRAQRSAPARGTGLEPRPRSL